MHIAEHVAHVSAHMQIIGRSAVILILHNLKYVIERICDLDIIFILLNIKFL